MPSVSIIVATSGRPTALEETLRSLATVQVPAGWAVDLLLVENVTQAGAESLLALLAGSGISTMYLFEPVRGKSRALNLALAAATGDVLLFSDDDVRFPVDWIERMGEPIFSGRADAVAGGVRLAPHLLRPWMNRTHRAWLASTADYLSSDNPSEICGANMALRRQIFDKIGGFDPELGPGITGGGEESLLSWQIRKAGFKILGALEIEIEHHPNPDRLLYKSWIRAAQSKGETRAIHRHHWFHEPIEHALVKKWWVSAKLALRRKLSPARKPDEEGIPPWELSYIEDIAKYSRYLRESKRARTYTLQGLRKNTADQQPVTA